MIAQLGKVNYMDHTIPIELGQRLNFEGQITQNITNE